MAHTKYPVIVATGFLAIALLVTETQVSWCQTGTDLRGLPNFGRVTENLYRGGQPSSDGLNALRSMGVGIVVNFRDDRAETATETRQVESLGLKYVGIPWSANHEPSSAQVVEFLDLVRATPPNTKIFVHCRRGADRTGLMIAAYRVAVQHKPVAEAVSEMHQYHYDWFFRPQLKRYVKSLPELLQKDPQFANYRPQAAAPAEALQITDEGR
ncbi:MAG: protein-tyrosine phosphatase family protein [Candidatus Sulfotelmatobacter sp.]